MNKMVISTTKQKENIHEVKLFLVHGLFFQKKVGKLFERFERGFL